MVRSLVGALIAVGEGRLSEAELSEVLKGKIRSSRFKVVSPQGLTLTAVNYPPEAEWKEQVSRARNRRDEEANWV
jgi:tRNA pseudouridine38-40 synthase